MQILVSLHDVTPGHRVRLERAEALLAAAGVDRVAYLIAPDFQERSPSVADSAFADWCQRDRPFVIDWALQGFRRGDEAEFLALEGAALGERLARSRRIVGEVVGVAPRAFVAPEWRFYPQLIPVLARQGFQYAEDRIGVIDVIRGVRRRCPVVSWAARTQSRRWRLDTVASGIFRLFSREPVVRLAIHPVDMDHPRTVDRIRRLLDRDLAHNRAAGYADLFRP